MQTLESIQKILENIEYKNWDFYVENRLDCYTLQIKFVDKCSVTGKLELQYCRKWFLSMHMTDNEIIRTAFAAVKMAEEHEMCEKFKYMGKLIANPHLDVTLLAEGVADFDNLDKRKDETIQTTIQN